MTSTSVSSSPPAAAAGRLPIETVAWTVLWAALGVFLLLVTGALAGARWYYRYALEPRPVQVRIIAGTLLVRSPLDPAWRSLPPQDPVHEGQTLRTDGTSQALLTLPDHSTVQVASGTELKLSRMGISRFTGERYAVRLDLLQGRIQVGVAPLLVGGREFTVLLPGARAALEEGSYTFTARDGQGLVRVAARGAADLAVGQGEPLSLAPGQRMRWSADGQTGGPETATEELIYNGDFAWGLQGWQVGSSLGFPEGADVEGRVAVETDPRGGPVVSFSRRYSRSTHAESYLYQDLDREVSDYSRLTLSLSFQLQHQSLSGGGYLGTEYPMAVRLVYRAANGEEHAFFTGFYSHNETGNRVDFGQQAPQNQWRTVSLPLNTLSPRPQRIVSVQVGASGWDYQSQLQSISLTGQ